MIVKTDEKNYQDIADAIREKNGSDTQYLPSEMAEAIRGIEVGFDWTKVGYPSNYDDSAVKQLEESAIYAQKVADEFNPNTIYGERKYQSYKGQIMPYIDTSKQQNMSWWWYLSEMEYMPPSLPTQNLTSCVAMFFEARRLTNAPLIDTSKCTNFNSIYIRCYNLKGEVFLDTSNATDLQQMFAYCWELQKIKFTSIKKNTTFNNTFNDMIRLEVLEADEWAKVNINVVWSSLLRPSSINYIIEHALGEEDGATARTLTLHATAKANWMDITKNPDYEYYQAMATEKLITIA